MLRRQPSERSMIPYCQDEGVARERPQVVRHEFSSSANQASARPSLMRVACTSVYDAQDPTAFGGRVYEALQSIKRRVSSMYFLGPLSTTALAPLLRVKGEYYRRLQGKTYFPGRDRLLIRSYAHQLSKRLSRVKADIVFGPMSPDSQPIAYLDCTQPTVIWTDATFAGVIDFNDNFRRDKIGSESLRDGIENERAALTRAGILIYWSEWAAETAIREYGINPDKVRVIPPGPASEAGIDNVQEARRVIAARPRDNCRFLFVGFDWLNKGGNTVLEVAKRLNAGGLRTDLTIVGCLPNVCGPLPEFVQTMGYIGRHTPAGANRLNELFRRSHFLFMPSRAEVFGLVYCEAGAFAVPSLATNVGGNPVRPGVNGWRFSLDADPDEYCEYISNLFANYGNYEELALSSFAEFKRRLNNDIAAERVLEVMAELL
jgi:glycosyltransferase involved in cell wall biosynthesis